MEAALKVNLIEFGPKTQNVYRGLSKTEWLLSKRLNFRIIGRHSKEDERLHRPW